MTDTAQADRFRKIRVAARLANRHLPDALPPVLALTDPMRTPDLLGFASNLPQGSGLIYRHFGEIPRHAKARALARLCKMKKILFLISADPGLACQIGADGIHWPETQMRHARKWRGRFKLMTCAAHSRLALARAQQMGLDAVLLSTVFSSDSPSANIPMGALKFRNRATQSSLPIYALGGLTADNMRQIAKFGGISGISGLNESKTKAS